ncbi:MAG: oligosaccharide flippase family protein [Oligoflexia bacterium]|nr:oligosaccharide flippase family protein [Oligoflexia bacterium]
MQIFFKIFKKSNYVKQVLLLLSGSVLAQILTLAVTPILTRLYTLDAFGVLAVLLAIVSILAPGVGGRYEAAIVIVASIKDRKSLFVVSMWLVFLLSSIFLLAILISQESIASLIGASALGEWLLVAPFMLFLIGFVAILKAFSNAGEDYSLIARSAILQNLIVGVLGIAFGYFDLVENGLVLSSIGGLIVVCAYMVSRVNKLNKFDMRLRGNDLNVAWKYRDFPLFNAPSSILNGAMTSLPVFFLAKYFTEAIVGQYALLIRMGTAPLSLIAESVSQINLKKIATLINEQRDPLPLFLKTTLVLFAIGVVPGSVICVFGPELFVLVFGPKWRMAGELLAILMPSLVVQFVVSTLSMSVVATGRLRLQAVWQFISLIVTSVVFYYAALRGDIFDFFRMFMVKDMSLYILYYTMLLFAIKFPVKKSI